MKTITRSQAVTALRQELLKLVDDEHSLCLVASRRGLFCNGFGRWTKEELERRTPWAMLGRHESTRAEVLRRANRWQLELQDLAEGRLPCDVDGGCRSPFCAGWDQFTLVELARFHREMCGDEVEVVPDEVPAA